MFLYLRTQSKEFFRQLRECSIEIMEYYGLPTSPGHKTKTWKYGRPIGVIEHFTAGVSWKGVVSWLNGSNNQKSSCHLLILDRRIGELDSIVVKYPMVDALPVTVILMADINAGTWHGNYANAYCFGIENRNVGMLRGEQENWLWWPKKWTTPFPHDKLGKIPINLDGVWWEPYTMGQIVANIVVCQHLHCLYQSEDGLQESWFLPHSAVSSKKWDTGRAFPFQEVKECVFEGVDIVDDKPHWLHTFKADPMYMADHEEDWDELFLEELAERQGERDEEEDDDEIMLSEPDADLMALIQDGKWRDELDSVRRGLEKLWYTTAGMGPELDPVTALAVYQFQKSMKLKADKIPGTETQKALYKRLKQFQLEK